jgi:hypothetical protein
MAVAQEAGVRKGPVIDFRKNNDLFTDRARQMTRQDRIILGVTSAVCYTGILIIAFLTLVLGWLPRPR